MNVNQKIFDATAEELTSYAMFHDMIKVMRAADGVEPAGACCGKNTKQIINSFILNKQKYFAFMENIKKRLIKPLRKGLVYVSPLKKMFNYELMTDKEIILCVKKGYLSKHLFDWTEYEKVRDEEPVKPTVDESQEEFPVGSPAEGDVPTEGPIEEPTEEPTIEETPVEKTPAEKPKRSSKKGSK